jgi:hypothetical protein
MLCEGIGLKEIHFMGDGNLSYPGARAGFPSDLARPGLRTQVKTSRRRVRGDFAELAEKPSPWTGEASCYSN